LCSLSDFLAELTVEFSGTIRLKRTEFDTEGWLGCKQLQGAAIVEMFMCQLLLLLLQSVKFADITGYQSILFILVRAQ
jgi:hypothetical protein